MCSVKTPFFRLTAVPCGSTTATRFPLPVDQVLEEAKRIIAIQAYKVTDVTNSPIDQSALANATVFNKSFLVLVSKQGNEEVISLIPLADLCRSANNGVLKEFGILPINVTKCYIQVASVTALSASEVWLLGFHYEK